MSKLQQFFNKGADEPNKDKYIACLLYGAIGDTIGFRNGIWETLNFTKTKKMSREKILEEANATDTIICEFVDLGGITGINLKGWKISDDTILHIANARGLSAKYKDMKRLYVNIMNEYMAAYTSEFEKIRNPGIHTLHSFEKIKKGEDWEYFPYDSNAGGSGGSMRSMCIGLAFHRAEDIDKLIEVAFISTRITHNNGIACLGSVVSALFTSFGIRDIPPLEWATRLIKLLDGDKVDKCIVKNVRKDDVEKYKYDKDTFTNKWKMYIEDNFDKNKFTITRSQRLFSAARLRNLFEKYSENKDIFFPGSGGDDSVIIAYDALLIAEMSWEKLVYKAMLHAGDNDTVGSIAAAWFGAYYGRKIVDGQISYIIPGNLWIHLEKQDEICELGEQLYDKYYK
ncbi:MAG: ADP-ribosylglycohydrolase [Faunusvirus sp.]|jgi:ADP-ribosylarginine hydrolase|uniref:ADP-ribosylglycohydrolase n=1 Tax=Faunusvirus sp. TaxID=2487766 RepID=A0A3G5A2R6_9VIRU|nr:MAG: ADP-ribosylglycohydrolase [Faunusvirus sp.]